MPRRIRVLTPENAVSLVQAAGLGKADLVSGKLPVSQLPALTKALVGLSNVDNTADASKPLSTAQKAYVDAAVTWKADASAVYTRAETDAKVAAASGGTGGGTAEAPIQRVIRQRADGTYPDRPDRSVLFTYDWQGNPAAPVSATKALAGVDTILLTDSVVA